MCCLKLGFGKEKDDTQDAGSWFLSCYLFLLVALFLLHVASISRSNETRLFPRIQERKHYRAGYQGKRIKTKTKKNKEWIKKNWEFFIFLLFLYFFFEKLKVKIKGHREIKIEYPKYQVQRTKSLTMTC